MLTLTSGSFHGVDLFLAGALGVPVMTFSLPPNAHMFGLAYNPWAPNTEIIYGDAEENWKRVLAQISERVGRAAPSDSVSSFDKFVS